MPKRLLFPELLIISCLLLPFGIWKLFHSGGAKSSSSRLSFPEVSLPAIQPAVNGEIDFYKGKLVVIAFSPTDCGICLEILTQLNDIYESSHNALPIVGIVGTPYKQAVGKIQERYALSFPLLYDSLSSVRNSLTHEPKPLLVLLSDGMIEKQALVGAPESIHEVESIMKTLLSK